MKSIAIYCGSSSGKDEIFSTQASSLGERLAKKNIKIIYGGAKVGLMGTLADGALRNGGKVIGVLPDFLGSKEIAHSGLSKLIRVKSMHERKAQMNQLCDGVIAMPGGFGTMEELFEMLTWSQLGLHGKPIGILNIDGFYDSLVALLTIMVEKGFLKKVNHEMLLISDDIDDLLHQMHNYVAPDVPKWLSEEST